MFKIYLVNFTLPTVSFPHFVCIKFCSTHPILVEFHSLCVCVWKITVIPKVRTIQKVIFWELPFISSCSYHFIFQYHSSLLLAYNQLHYFLITLPAFLVQMHKYCIFPKIFFCTKKKQYYKKFTYSKDHYSDSFRYLNMNYILVQVLFQC